MKKAIGFLSDQKKKIHQISDTKTTEEVINN